MSHAATLRRPSIFQLLLSSQRSLSTKSTHYPKPAPMSPHDNPDDMRAARKWCDDFEQFDDLNSVPFIKDNAEITHSRSSGPGGQNVNKVSTKATLRFPISLCRTMFPDYIIPILKESKHHSSTPLPDGSILLTSSRFRTQPENMRDVWDKFKEVILEAGRRDLIGETKEGKGKRIKALVEKQNAVMAKVKRERKDVKQGRRMKCGWD
ncbi:hypothetical protein T439DRAFT_93303 [Meredithblackwellia eburnea MCA 4105]